MINLYIALRALIAEKKRAWKDLFRASVPMAYFKMPVARSRGKDKQTLSSRRYLARVLSSLMYRYGLRP